MVAQVLVNISRRSRGRHSAGASAGRIVLESPAGQFVQHHGKIANEYTLLQFAKLHDRPSNRRNKNLVIGYFTQCEDWQAREYRQVDQVSLRLKEFYRTNIRDVGNKILAHNDLETCRKNTILGQFYQAEGEAYLHDLSQLATLVWTRWHCAMDRPTKTQHEFSISARTGRPVANARKLPKRSSTASNSVIGN